MAKTSKGRLRQARQQQAKQQKQRWGIGLAVAAVGIIALIAWAVLQNQAAKNLGQHVAYQNQEHIREGEEHIAYNSDPPTSGPHYDTPADPGFYDTPIADEAVIHNLEHGYVAVSYDCDKLADCASVQTRLQTLMDKYRNFKVMAVPRSNRDAAIAVTAWQRIDLMDEYDEARISAFIDAWRDKGPEKTPN